MYCATDSCRSLQNGTVPLMWVTVTNGDPEIAKLLIQKNAELENSSNKVSGGSVCMLWWPREFATSIACCFGDVQLRNLRLNQKEVDWCDDVFRSCMGL